MAMCRILTEYPMNAAWSIESVDCHGCHTAHMSCLHVQKPANDPMDPHIRRLLVSLAGSRAQWPVWLCSRSRAFVNPRNAPFCPVNKVKCHFQLQCADIQYLCHSAVVPIYLWSRHKHGAAPVIQTENVSTMAAERLEWCGCGTIGYVYLTIAGTAANQQARLIGAVLQEAQITHCAIVHGQLDLFALQLFLYFIVAHQFDCFIIGSGGNEITLRRPGHTIDWSFVVFGAFE